MTKQKKIPVTNLKRDCLGSGHVWSSVNCFWSSEVEQWLMYPFVIDFLAFFYRHWIVFFTIQFNIKLMNKPTVFHYPNEHSLYDCFIFIDSKKWELCLWCGPQHERMETYQCKHLYYTTMLCCLSCLAQLTVWPTKINVIFQ